MIEFIILLISIALVIMIVRLVVGRKPGEFIKKTNLLGKLILVFIILWWVWRLTDGLPEAGSYRENIRNGRGLCNISFISKGNPSCYYSRNKLQRIIELFNDEVLSIVVSLGIVAIVGMKRGKKV